MTKLTMDQKCSKYYCYKNTRKPVKDKISETKKIKLVVFDMDGVIVDSYSSWKYMHDYFKTSNEKSVDEYLKGNIDDMEFIRRDVSLWVKDGKPITKYELYGILSRISLMKGAEECISFIKNHNIKTAIVSAGLDVLAKKVSKHLDIDHFYANGVKYNEEGYLTGEGIIGVKLMYKDENIIDLSKKLDIPLESIATVGNSCFDIPMFEVSGLGIAFNPDDECVKNSADYVVEDKNLTNVLPIIKKYF